MLSNYYDRFVSRFAVQVSSIRQTLAAITILEKVSLPVLLLCDLCCCSVKNIKKQCKIRKFKFMVE